LIISIIGAGRVGQTLGRLARDAGYEVADVVCLSRRKAARAARFIGAGRPLQASGARLSGADLVLIATPDDKVKEAARLIEANIERAFRPVVLHTSGVLESSALGSLAARGLSVGSCHPLQTFESPARTLALVEGSYFCVEGDPRAVRAARSLVRRIGARSFRVDTHMKSLYHAAAVMASGGVAALFDISLEMLGRCGLGEREAAHVLLPLVEGAVANVRAVGPARALTGPVRRGDAGTVERNIKALADADSDWLEIYRRLAAHSIEMAERAGTDKQALGRLRKLLKK
jgi:predicted short-subunit dehydrogenase-like oxidoreductase (DUF2520 family)